MSSMRVQDVSLTVLWLSGALRHTPESWHPSPSTAAEMPPLKMTYVLVPACHIYFFWSSSDASTLTCHYLTHLGLVSWVP